MKSTFRKKHRMLAYAYALEKYLANDTKDYEGACYYLRDFLKEVLGYDMENFFFCDSKYEFPELWEERTNDLKEVYFEWFNSTEERIQALKNILKIKE